MKCTNCGHEDALGKKFCTQCGTKLVSDAFSSVIADKKDEPAGENAFADISTKSEQGEELTEAFGSYEEAKPVVFSAPAFEEAPSPSESRMAERCPAFAEGLPEWDLVPPDTMVMRGGKF